MGNLVRVWDDEKVRGTRIINTLTIQKNTYLNSRFIVTSSVAVPATYVGLRNSLVALLNRE